MDKYLEEMRQSRQAAELITTPRKKSKTDSQMSFVLGGKANGVTVGDFSTNPSKYGYSKVSFNDAAEGDVFVASESGEPMEALVYTGKRDAEGWPLFNYVDWNNGNKVVKNARFLSPEYFNENIFTVYRHQ